MKTISKKLLSLYLTLLGKEFKEMKMEDKQDFVEHVIDELCDENELPKPKRITFSNINNSYGEFNVLENIININLDDLLQEPDYQFILLDTMLHEMKHYEQHHNSKDRLITLGLEGALPTSDKDYIFQKHEQEAYRHTINQLRDIAKILNFKELDDYAHKSELIFKEKQHVDGVPDILLSLYLKSRQKEIIKKQEKMREFNNNHKSKLSKYYPESIANPSITAANLKLDNGYNAQGTLEIRENNNYLEADIEYNNCSILHLYIKNNSSAIIVNDVSENGATNAAINLSKTIIDYYNEKNSKNVQNIDVVFNQNVNLQDANKLCDTLKVDVLNPVVKSNTTKEIDKIELKNLKNRILESKESDMHEFLFDGQKFQASSKMSDELFLLKINDLMRDDDKLLVKTFEEYNKNISSVFQKDISDRVYKYHTKAYEAKNFNMRELLINAKIIAPHISSSPITTSLEEELENNTYESEKQIIHQNHLGGDAR